MLQAVEVDLRYNRSKENSKNRKNLHTEESYVPLQQWTDQPVRFQVAGRDESKREQPVREKSTDNPVAGD